MESYKSTQIELEDNARMFVRTGDTEIEINVRPTEVKLEQEKLSKTNATEFRQEQLKKQEADYFVRDMVESQLIENHNLVITNRGTGRSHQTVLYMIDDPKVVTLVRDKFQKKNLLDILKKLIGEEDNRFQQISNRVVTYSFWENNILPRCSDNIVLHIDNVEHYLEYKLGRHVNSFTTGHRAVSGFSNEFNKAEEV